MGRKKQNPLESEKRKRIVKRAGMMFTQLGYSEVSMDALARAVPVSKRTLYNHFRDKQALFQGVMQARCQHLFDNLRQTIEGGKNVQQTLTRIGDQFLGKVLEPEALNIYRIAITEAHHFPTLGKLFYENGPKRSSGLLADYLRGLDAGAILKVKNPQLAAEMFLSMIINRVQMKTMMGIKKTFSQRERKELVAYAVDIFLTGHRYG